MPLGQHYIVRSSPDGYVSVRVDGKVGLMSVDGEWLIAPEYEDLWCYSSPELNAVGGPFIVTETQDGDLARRELRSLWSRERINQVELSWCGIPRLTPFPVTPLASGGLAGYMNLQGEMVIEAQYLTAVAFVDGRARVGLTRDLVDTLCGTSGKEAVGQDEQLLESCEEVDRQEGWINAYIDEQGQVIGRIDYQSASDFSEGRAKVLRDGLYGFIDVNGVEVIPPRFIMAESFSNGAASVQLADDGHSAAFIDETGQVWFDGYCRVESFSEGLAAVVKNCRTMEGKGYIDRNGAYVIRGLSGGPFIGGSAWVHDTVVGGYGRIDKEGKWLVPYRLSREPDTRVVGFWSFGFGRFSIPSKDEEYDVAWINPEGKLIWPPGWDDPCYESGIVRWPEGACAATQ
jgi:hypothetical protein